MGKERRLEKKIKKLEEVASVGGAANEVASTVVAELSSSPSSAVDVAAKVNEKEKKPRKKRTKKTVEPVAESDTSPTANANTLANSELVIPQPAVVAAAQSEPAPPSVLAHSEQPAAMPAASSPQITSSSESTSTPPVVGETESSARSAPITSEASEAILEESAQAPISLGNLNSVPSTEAPKTTDQKLDMLSDAVYEFVTEQILALRALRETVAVFASEECQKSCDAKLRKRPRPIGSVSTPKKRRLTGFQVFCQVKRLELTPAKQAFTELGRMWKELTDDERAHFKTEAERLSVANDGQHSDQILDGGGCSHEVTEDMS